MTDPLLPEEQVDDFLNIRVVRLATKLQRLMLRRALRDADLPVLEWRLMFELAQGGENHLRQITQNRSLDPAHTSRAAALLERKGLISRRDDPADHRRKLLSLTAAGRALVIHIWTEAQTLSASLKSEFSEQEFATFKQLLDRAHVQADTLLAVDAIQQVEEPAE